ncbi:PREDICTED: bifunctional ATP-dependent dihydroxyacetone kinase/FAD-AMP lyase (cyclizing)-like isoform X2 [Vollenhovia emeryi]|uniref:bifunctional ATP-dependent dihydroxyacetone kinase/FAD-AMP lyase (cyclizing)-like isoform X2 n=1 Tax=Vollenhovia emeryi TaxID=411798 RepID=UPI0005F4E3FF|nr:PREDICTED: bifunctional ATP-dependent dihydroxyacetone kinase/FAD-AMP lyase (cyclizing)-like isoform X2 [Vollenhovia emeryi]
MAMSKNLINSLDDAVSEALSGLSYTYPQLEYHVSHRVVLSPDHRDRRNKVALVCGGGSGHEPFAAGFVGSGMLTASIAGSIFAAPPSTHITYALRCIAENNKVGIMVVVPNYTGDCLNFGIAIEKARQTGVMVEEVIVDDDCSIPENERSVAGKRGLVGMLFVIKIAGALAEKGLPLCEVAEIARRVSQSTATYGIGLSACAVPGQGLMFELAQDEIECGMGVHGEAGYERIKLRTASELVTLMLKRICEALSLSANDSVAVIVNNFGALSQLEQGIVVHEVVNQLQGLGIQPVRVYSGILMTSLNSVGIHVSLLKLTESHGDVLVECLDEETTAPCWPGCAYSISSALTSVPSKDAEKRKMGKIGISLNARDQRLIESCLRDACAAIVEKEAYLNGLDRGCGDGDCGSTLKRFADGILSNLDSLSLSHPAALLAEMADIAEERMGGTSGALYCLFFTTAAKTLTSFAQGEDLRRVWHCAFRSGLNCLEKYGKARAGDRTMIDTMHGACTAYERLLEEAIFPGDFYDKIMAAAWEGCYSTRNMKPKAGRASYIKQAQYLTEVDAGAYAAAIWIAAIVQTITHSDV